MKLSVQLVQQLVLQAEFSVVIFSLSSEKQELK